LSGDEKMPIQDVFDSIRNIEVIKELNHEHKREYYISSFEKTLLPLIKENQIIVVAGAYFGDEGKGKITDAIANCDLVELILRMNSGENAGHTVVADRRKFVFNLTPSGILVPGKVNGIGPECVMDPVSYMQKEISQLVNAGIKYKDRLFVGNVHIVGPHHKILDFTLSPANSSTLMGMSYVHAAKVSKRGLRLDHLFNDRTEAEKRLKKDLDTYHALMQYNKRDEKKVLEDLREEMARRNKTVPQHLADFLVAADKMGCILNMYEREVVQNSAFPKRRDVCHMAREYLRKGKKVLLESPQSFFLSNSTEKHWPSSTSAQTHAAGVIASANINPAKHPYVVVNVAKTPCDSRVGIGANPSSFVPQNYFSKQKINTLDSLEGKCMNFEAIQKEYFGSIQPNGILNPVKYTDTSGTYLINEAMSIAAARKFGEKGATTGKPRVVGLFDCLAAKLVNDVQGPYLSISAMDRGDDMDYIGITVGYVFHHPKDDMLDSNGIVYKNGDIIRIGDEYPCDQVLEHCYPIIKVMPSWKNTPIGVDKRKPEDLLPENVQAFIGTIEDLTELKVISIGNGQDTKNLIYIKRADER
jgi:adenylosuccinate synthase